MLQKYKDDEGNEVEAVPAEEFAKTQLELETLRKEKEELAAEKARLEAGGDDKDKNFASFRAKLEGTEKQLGEVSKKLADKEEHERKVAKEELTKHFAGDDKEAREKFEKAYGFVNIAEDTPENILERGINAAKMSGLYKEEGGSNPIFRGIFGGGAPNLKPTKVSEDDADNVLNTPKGKSGLSAMGVPEDYGQEKK